MDSAPLISNIMYGRALEAEIAQMREELAEATAKAAALQGKDKRASFFVYGEAILSMRDRLIVLEAKLGRLQRSGLLSPKQ